MKIELHTNLGSHAQKYAEKRDKSINETKLSHLPFTIGHSVKKLDGSDKMPGIVLILCVCDGQALIDIIHGKHVGHLPGLER
jgi:hypothetical protein